MSSSNSPLASQPFDPSRYFSSGPSGYSLPFSPPSMPSSFQPNYRAPIPATMSLIGRTTPILPSSFPVAPGQLSIPFSPPPSLSSYVPPALHPRPLPPYSPSFIDSNTLHVRTERFSSPSSLPSLPSSWGAPLPSSPHLVPPLPSSFSTGPSLLLPPNLSIPYHPVSLPPAIRPLDPASLRFPDSHVAIPLPTFAVPSFLPPSLSGRAHFVSSFPAFQPSSFRNPTWTPPPLRQPTFPSDNALVRLPGNYSFPLQHRTNFTFEAQAQIQQSYRRQFEQTMKMTYQLDAPPERPFPQPMPQLVFQLDRHTTLLVDPAVLTDLFERTTSAQRWAFQAQVVKLMDRRDQNKAKFQEYERLFCRLNCLPEKTAVLIHELPALALHSTAKVGGLVVENLLALSECLNPAYTPGKPRTSALVQWQNRAVPAIHRKIDELFSTNMTDEFDSRNDPWYERFVQSILANPIGVLRLEYAAVKIAQAARQVPKLVFALEGAAAQRAGKILTEGEVLAGPRIASMETTPGTQVAKFANERASTNLLQLEKRISEWLGEGTQFIRNKPGDPVFLSKDGLRKVRFDFNRPAPHQNPHLHLEHLVDGEWQEISRVYPIDVPHK